MQVHLALVHYFIKQEKKSVFTAIVHEIVVLRLPPAAPVNPLKRGQLSDGPSMSRSGPSKKFHDVSAPSSLTSQQLTIPLPVLIFAMCPINESVHLKPNIACSIVK